MLRGKSMFAIVKEPIDVSRVIQAVVDRNAGAIVTFIGTVRELTNGKKTLYLEYEAYESMAKKSLNKSVRKLWSASRKRRWRLSIALAV